MGNFWWDMPVEVLRLELSTDGVTQLVFISVVLCDRQTGFRMGV